MSRKSKQKDKKKKEQFPEHPEFNKYVYYEKSVQSADVDVLFLNKTYKEIRNKSPKVLREDFCGTFMISTEWVKLDPSNKAIGLDLDPEPIEFGKLHHLSKLTEEQQSRVEILEQNVLKPKCEKADIIVAPNFSYFGFKTRALMMSYAKACLKSLNEDGMVILDCLGGSDCFAPNVEETEHKDFSYFWDQDSFDPITNFATFYIHFKRKGEKKIREAFTYDWRMWSIPELKDIFLEAGYSNFQVYWEGTDKDGDGDGVYKPQTEGEDCETWVCYLVAEK